jgi:hypothetical protein
MHYNFVYVKFQKEPVSMWKYSLSHIFCNVESQSLEALNVSNDHKQ